LRTHDDFQTFYTGLQTSNIILSNTSPHASVSSFMQWDVLQYLEAPEHQDVALWPTVLGIFCKTYSDLVSSAMTITAMANTDDMRGRLADVRPVSTPAKCPNCGAPLGHLFPGDLSRATCPRPTGLSWRNICWTSRRMPRHGNWSTSPATSTCCGRLRV